MRCTTSVRSVGGIWNSLKLQCQAEFHGERIVVIVGAGPSRDVIGRTIAFGCVAVHLTKIDPILNV